MIIGRSYVTTPGLSTFTHFSLASVRILGVARQGLELTKVSFLTTPVNDQFNYLGIGRIRVDAAQPFIMTPTGPEKLYVLYDT